MVQAALRSVLTNPRLKFGILLSVLAARCVCPAQTQEPLQKTIAEEVQQIRSATDHHLADEQLGYLWARLASDYRKAGNFSEAEGAYMKALSLLGHTSSAKANYATALDNLGMLYLNYGRLDDAEAYSRKAFVLRGEIDSAIDRARSQQHLAEIDLARHKFKAAESKAADAFQSMSLLKDADQLDLISVLNTLTFARCVQRKCAEGMQNAQQSLDIARTSFGSDSLPTAYALMAVGFAAWKLGELEEADRTMRAGVQMMKTQAGPNSQAVLLALIEYRDYLKGVHRSHEAKDIDEELASTARKGDPSCPTCVSVYSLSNTVR